MPGKLNHFPQVGQSRVLHHIELETENIRVLEISSVPLLATILKLEMFPKGLSNNGEMDCEERTLQADTTRGLLSQ